MLTVLFRVSFSYRAYAAQSRYFYQMRVRAYVEARARFSADIPHSAAELRVAVYIADVELPRDLVLFARAMMSPSSLSVIALLASVLSSRART